MIRGLVIALVVGIAVWLLALLILVIIGRKEQARELAAAIPNLLILFRGLLRDPRVPRRSKIWLVVAVIWIASPIDLVPEFIPVLGPADDVIVAALVLRHVLRRTDRSILAEYWRGDPSTLDRIVGSTRPVVRPRSGGA
ncbi:MAG TPA: DUF1232 domain-containing protein [Actinomycetota bacterium]|nr:DUF1232 domain-containing protein [Actinomycetota bacterium]